METIPNGQILEKLKISYDSLHDSHDQDLFLHIACFFVGMDKDVIVTILDDCDFFTDVGIQNLIDRHLVTVDYDNMVQMHHMIRDMGRGIVRQESKEPGERSRLWHHKDSFKVLTEKTGTETIEGLVLKMQMHPAYAQSKNSNDQVVFETEAFSRMHKLRFLEFSNVQVNGSYQELPPGLKWLCWPKFPLVFIPSDFSLKSLVVLDMCYSSLGQVWKGTECLPSLKILNLSHCNDLTETPDFSLVLNLERLILTDCASLVEIHESIGSLKRLVYLNMEDCKNIRKLPNSISSLTFLETLIISGCSSLNEFPLREMGKMESMKVFHADGVPIHRLLITAKDLELSPRQNVEISWASYLPHSLVNLSLGRCKLSDDDFPTDFGNLPFLQRLDLSDNPICSLPDCIRGLTGLHYLSFGWCTKLKSLVRLPSVGQLRLHECQSLERVTFQSLQEFSGIRSIAAFRDKLAEFEYLYKVEPIEKVDKEMIDLLGLSNLKNSTETKKIDTYCRRWCLGREGRHHPIQGLYEYGIFSTFLPGNEVPGSFSHKSRGSSISFTVPLLPDHLRIRGLNFFSVYAKSNTNFDIGKWDSPMIAKVSNKAKDLKWMYAPLFFCLPDEGQDMIWLSHWKFGNKLEPGDEVTFSVLTMFEIQVKECGVHLVYEQELEEKMMMSTLDNATDLFYPNVIAGDLSKYLVSGIYFLSDLMYPAINGDNKENSGIFKHIVKEYQNETTDREEEHQSDHLLAARRSSNSNAIAKRNNSGRKVWKVVVVVIIMANVLYLSSLLVFYSLLFRRTQLHASATTLTPT